MTICGQAWKYVEIGGWCREGESNPQGPKPGGF
jgi:hypothetical protein